MVLPRRLAKITQVVAQRQSGLVVVIEDIHDPHNAEAIFRTCDALGVQEVHLIFEQEPPWNPQKLGKKSSSSAHKWLTFHTHRSTEECLRTLKKKGYLLVASTLDASSGSLLDASFGSHPVALLVGNEHRGLSSTALSLSDMRLILPMRGMVESLNVSVATALFLYEITRQRMGEDFSLPAREKRALIDSFLSLSKRTKA